MFALFRPERKQVQLNSTNGRQNELVIENITLEGLGIRVKYVRVARNRSRKRARDHASVANWADSERWTEANELTGWSAQSRDSGSGITLLGKARDVLRSEWHNWRIEVCQFIPLTLNSNIQLSTIEQIRGSHKWSELDDKNALG